MATSNEDRVTCIVGDDHPATVRAVCSVLEERGIDVVGRARDGEEAAVLIAELDWQG